MCHSESQKMWRKANPLTDDQRKKMNCRSYTHVYLKRGKLTRKNCEVCDSKESEIHHPDYDKPLEVVWLCRKHHLETHSERNRRSKNK